MYDDINDYELLDKVSDDDKAVEIIIEKYSPLINKIASKIYYKNKITGIEVNDLIQEGMIGLNIAINNFDQNRDTTFFTFARMCIIRKISSYVSTLSRYKHQLLNESLSVEILAEDVKYKEKYLQDKDSNPENVLISDETSKELMTKIESVLTNLECEIFELRTAGFTYKEIGELLEKDTKSVSNAIMRIKNKIKNINIVLPKNDS